jgi:hypothetical protein
MLDARFAPAPEGQPNCSVLLLFNATGEEAIFSLPKLTGHEAEWTLRVDTGEGQVDAAGARRLAAQDRLELMPHSMALLTQAPQE